MLAKELDKEWPEKCFDRIPFGKLSFLYMGELLHSRIRTITALQIRIRQRLNPWLDDMVERAV